MGYLVAADDKAYPPKGKAPKCIQKCPPNADGWREEVGTYITVGVVNANPEAPFSKPSDGCMDLILARRGGILGTIKLGLSYIVGTQFSQPLLSYIKVLQAVIDPENSSCVCNADGETISEGPFSMKVLPSHLNFWISRIS